MTDKKSTYTVTGLTSSTQYTFIVKDEVGNLSEASNQETITTTKPTSNKFNSCSNYHLHQPFYHGLRQMTLLQVTMLVMVP
jgi:hypothetical protein